MKKLIRIVFVLALLAALTLPLTAALAEDTTMYVRTGNTGRLHLRTQPSVQAASLGLYANGTPITVHSTQNGWATVTVGGQNGFMLLSCLTAVPPVGPVPTAVPTARPTAAPTYAPAPTTDPALVEKEVRARLAFFRWSERFFGDDYPLEVGERLTLFATELARLYPSFSPDTLKEDMNTFAVVNGPIRRMRASSALKSALKARQDALTTPTGNYGEIVVSPGSRACTGPFPGPMQAFSAISARTGPRFGPVQALILNFARF